MKVYVVIETTDEFYETCSIAGVFSTQASSEAYIERCKRLIEKYFDHPGYGGPLDERPRWPDCPHGPLHVEEYEMDTLPTETESL